jgi:hypothetical protein
MIALLCNYIKGKQKGKTFFVFLAILKFVVFFVAKWVIDEQ